MKITKRQKQLYDYIKGRVEDGDLPPTVSEMAKYLKVKSKNAVAKLLNALEDAGLLKRDGTARGIEVFDEYGNEVLAGGFMVPLLGTVPAGGPVVAEEHIEEWVNLPTHLVTGRKKDARLASRQARQVFILQVRGDSMERAGILENDLVIVRPTKEIKNNDIVVALLEDEVTVKRYIEVKGRKYLKPENPKYENIYPESEWTIQGKVVGIIRKLE